MITARAGPATVRSPYEVTGYDPPGLLAGHGAAGPVRFQEEYRLTQDGPATIVTQSITAAPPRPVQLAPGLLRRQLRKLIASEPPCTGRWQAAPWSSFGWVASALRVLAMVRARYRLLA